MSLVLSLPPKHPKGDLDDDIIIVGPRMGATPTTQVSVVVGDRKDDPGDLMLLHLLPHNLVMQVLISTKLYSKNLLISSSK